MGNTNPEKIGKAKENNSKIVVLKLLSQLEKRLNPLLKSQAKKSKTLLNPMLKNLMVIKMMLNHIKLMLSTTLTKNGKAKEKMSKTVVLILLRHLKDQRLKVLLKLLEKKKVKKRN